MKRLIPSLLLFVLSSTAAPLGADTWPFEPARDSFSDDALLDLRNLNEEEAGESGFLQVDDQGDFILGNGDPVRLWCVNTNVGREQPWRPKPRGRQTEPDLDYHARFLAKRGVNMVRCHSHINPAIPKEGDGPPIDHVNASEVDWIQRTVAAMKQQGIYTTISPYWANSMQSDDAAWGTDWNGRHHALLFFDSTMQEAYKAWLKQLFAEPNPHTGMPLAQDPAVGIIQIQNEDSLLFWTVNNLKGGPRARLGKEFANWASDKYGSLEEALTAWDGETLPADQLEQGVLDFRNIHDLTSGSNAPDTQRLADQLQFWAETMHAFNQEIARYLREDLGCQQLINAGNWKTADTVALNDAERWTYTANEVSAVNRYFSGLHLGKHRGWAILDGDQYSNASVLQDDALKFPLNIKLTKGHPMLVTESSWVMPNDYASEGPFLIAAYGALTGFDGFYWFATGDDGWTPPGSANGYLPSQKKWTFANPDMLGQFPAAALAYRLDFVKRGEPVVVEKRALKNLWNRTRPIIAETSGFDPNRDSGDISTDSSVKTAVDPRAFLVGPVEVEYGADPSESEVMDLTHYISGDGTKIESVTGELTLDTKNHFCTLDAPKAQGVTAFFKGLPPFELSDVTIECQNEYGAILVAAIDGKPLKQSAKILVQVGTQSRPTGWEIKETTIESSDAGEVEGFEVVSYGKAPWQVDTAQANITVKNPALTQAMALDANGMPVKEVPVTKTDEGLEFRFPPGHLYVVLQ